MLSVSMNSFMNVSQVMEELQVSRAKAYKIMADLNRELEVGGYITVRGIVNTDYFRERCCYHGAGKGGTQDVSVQG